LAEADSERTWLERELAELRTREADYRTRLSRNEADAARLRAHAESLHQLLRRRPLAKDEQLRTLADVARLSAQALQIHRTSVWFFDPAQQNLSCVLQWIDDAEVAETGLSIPCQSCPAYVRALGEESAVAVHDVYDDARTLELSAYLREHRVSALLDIPIVIAGALLGVVCHEHVGGRRTWQANEIEFASNVGHLVALTLETERRLDAEYAARGTEAKYRYLVESLPVTVYSFDAHTSKLEYVSPRALELAGQPAQSWLARGAKAWVERIHPDDRAPVLQRFERGARAGAGFPEEVTYRVRLDDGRQRWIRDTCRVVRDHAGQAIALQGVLADVTDSFAAQLERKEIERRYRALLENADVIALMLDPAGKVSFANDAYVRTSGFTREQLIGLDWFAGALAPAIRDGVRKRFLDDVGRGTVAPRFELGIVTRAGETRQLLSTNILLRAPDGTTEGTLSLAIDVTERRALEVELLQQTKLESLGRLAAGVAHDFNNLLTVMLGQLKLLQGRLGTGDQDTNAALQALDQAVEQASDLTRSLLLYGRKQPARDELFSLDALVRETLPLLEALAGRELRVSASLHAEDARLSLDRARVRQVLVNLVGNATDATLGHGKSIRITTHVELIEDAAARARGAVGGGEYVVLTIADDGRGMDARTLGHIFDPFFTTKTDGRGTGLGLAITQTVTSQAGGFIAVSSVPGEGTTFRVNLPSHKPRARSVVPAERRSSQAPEGTTRVLVVDDQPLVRDLVAGALRRADFDVVAVGDARSATEVLGSTAIDLLITDLHLPDSSGSVLARSARSARPNLRVVLMSGSLDEGEPFDGVLAKPFDEAQLLKTVRATLAAG
jgi:PAS domain S-box-containing protein